MSFMTAAVGGEGSNEDGTEPARSWLSHNMQLWSELLRATDNSSESITDIRDMLHNRKLPQKILQWVPGH